MACNTVAERKDKNHAACCQKGLSGVAHHVKQNKSEGGKGWIEDNVTHLWNTVNQGKNTDSTKHWWWSPDIRIQTD